MKVIYVVPFALIELRNVRDLRIGQTNCVIVRGAEFGETVVIFLLPVHIVCSHAIADEESPVLCKARMERDAGQAFGAAVSYPIGRENAVANVQEELGMWVGEICDD